MRHTVVLLGGDGSGPALLAQVVRVLDAVGWSARYVDGELGLECWRRTGRSLPRDTVERVAEHGLALVGEVAAPTKDLPGWQDPLASLWRSLGLELSLVPVASEAVDAVVVSHPWGDSSALAAGRVAVGALGQALLRADERLFVVEPPGESLLWTAAEEVGRSFPHVPRVRLGPDEALLRVAGGGTFLAEVGCAAALTDALVAAAGEGSHAVVHKRLERAAFQPLAGGDVLAAIQAGVMLLGHTGCITQADRVRRAADKVRAAGHRGGPGGGSPEAVADAVIEAMGDWPPKGVLLS